ncbi:MAG: hypothetical protein ACREEE_01920, partial [Dongiaceae bacterium]
MTEKVGRKGKRRAIPLDIASAVSNFDVSDDAIIRVEDVPVGAILSAGGSNANGSWSLSVADLDDLHLLTQSSDALEHTLTVRIVIPDPEGYEYAETKAKFEVLVTDAGGFTAFSGLQSDDRGRTESKSESRSELGSLLQLSSLIDRGRKRAEGKPAKPSLNLVDGAAVKAFEGQRSSATLARLLSEEDKREADLEKIVEAEAEWKVAEERRVSAERARWQAEEEDRLKAALAKAKIEESARIAQIEVRHKAALSEHLANAEARWRAKEAKLLTAARAELESQRPLWRRDPNKGAQQKPDHRAEIQAQVETRLAEKLAAAETEWRSAEEVRLAAARQHWQSEIANHPVETDKVSQANADELRALKGRLAAQHADELARLKSEEAEHLAAARAQWDAEAAQRANDLTAA